MTDPLILETDTRSPLVQLFLWFQAGPALDPPGKEGLTALTSRALIRGTRRRDRRAVEEAVEALGTELVTSTQRQAIGVGGTLLVRHLPTFVALLTEVVTEPAFSEEEVDRTRREMQAELDALVDDDAALAQRWIRRTLFANTRFAHGANGYAESLDRLTVADVVAWHRTVFCKASLVVAASGALDRAGLEAALAPLMAALPEGEAPHWDLPEPAAPTPSLVIVDKAERGQAQILAGHPTISAHHPDSLALGLATTAFGGTFTARLMQEVRVKRGLSYGAYASLAGERAGGHYLLQAAPEASDAVETLGLLRSEYARFVTEGLTDDEVEFARQNLIASFAFAVETPALVASQRVRNRLLGRPDDAVETYRARVAAFTADEVRAAVRRHLRPDDVSAVVVGEGESLEPALAALGLPITVVQP